MAWHREGQQARLRLTGLTAALCPERPDEGLRDLHILNQPWAGAQLLGVMVPSAPQPLTPVEWHLRGHDLIALYDTSLDPALRVELLWRVAPAAEGDRFSIAVDLIVSLWTQRLESRPELVVESLLPGQISSYGPPARGPDACGFHWSRPTNVPWSYLEMAHLADLRHDESTSEPDRPEFTRLRHFLFPSQPIEKGVTLRARVRGVFLPSDADAETVAACYDAFVRAEPPLGT